MNVNKDFYEWLLANANKEQLLSTITSIREDDNVYGNMDEFLEGNWDNWEEYVDEVAGNSYGYSETFSQLIESYYGEDKELEYKEFSELYGVFMDYLIS